MVDLLGPCGTIVGTGVVQETKVKIPAHAKPHLLEYIDLQMEAFDEERLRSDLDAY
jgi:hypothetical protein